MSTSRNSIAFREDRLPGVDGTLEPWGLGRASAGTIDLADHSFPRFAPARGGPVSYEGVAILEWLMLGSKLPLASLASTIEEMAPRTKFINALLFSTSTRRGIRPPWSDSTLAESPPAPAGLRPLRPTGSDPWPRDAVAAPGRGRRRARELPVPVGPVGLEDPPRGPGKGTKPPAQRMAYRHRSVDRRNAQEDPTMNKSLSIVLSGAGQSRAWDDGRRARESRGGDGRAGGAPPQPGRG